MRILFLGTGGSTLPPGRLGPCLVVETSHARILIDVGEGCSRRLEEEGFSLCDFDIVFISHLHIDHYAGISSALIRAASRGCHRRVQVVVGPEVLNVGAKESIMSILPRSLRDRLEVRAIDKAYTIGNTVITVIRVQHAVPTYGVAISCGGVSFVYSSDTRPCVGGNIAVVSESELVVHEATLPDNLEELASETGHSTVSGALSCLKYMSDDSTLALVHLTPESEILLRRWRNLPRNVIVPFDHTILSL